MAAGAILGLLFSTVLGAATPAMAQETKTAASSIRVAYYEAGYLNSGGKGIDRDVVAELAKRGGYRFEHVDQPRARIWVTLESGELPMSVSGLQTPARDKFAYFVPYIAQKNKALVLGDKKIDADAFAADKSSRMAVVRGFKHGDYFDRLIISQPALYAKALKEKGLESKVSVQDLDTQGKGVNLGLILSKAHFTPADVAKMQGIINDMKKDGTLAAIFAKYLNKQDAAEALQF